MWASTVRVFVGLALVGSACAGCAGCANSPPPKAEAASKTPEDRDPVVLFERGKSFAELGDLVRAEQYMGAAIKSGADERIVVPALVKVCVAAKHYRLASQYAELLLARNPDDAHLRLVVGALYVSIGNPALAREHLEQAARELSGEGEVQYAVACFFRDDLADRAAADRYFREYLRLDGKGAHAAEARASLMERVQ